MPIFSNIDEVGRWLEETIQSIGFQTPASDGNMGQAIVHKLAANISERGYAESSGPDSQWPGNADRYLRWKERNYAEDRPNVRTQQMLSQESVEGEVAVTDDQVDWQYGKGEPPAHGGPRDILTDREKGALAHSGQGPYGVQRPFFGVTDEDGADALLIAGETVADYIRSKL